MQKIKKPVGELIEMQLDPNSSAPLNIYEIRNFIYYGFHSNSFRPKYWKVLLNYYSTSKFKSESYYAKNRKAYHEIQIPNDMRNQQFKESFDKDVTRTSLLSKSYPNYTKPVENVILKYAATNPSVGYIQGMIYLIVPLYHVLATSESLDDVKYAEEDSFYLFHNLMNDFNNYLTSDSTDVPTGIKSKVKEVFKIVKVKDPKIYKTLADKELIDHAFPVKWMLQFFTNSYSMDDLLFLWDKILSDAYRFEILTYLCTARIFLLRDKILSDDHFHCMQEFEGLCKISVKKLFLLADELRRSNKSALDILALKKFK